MMDRRRAELEPKAQYEEILYLNNCLRESAAALEETRTRLRSLLRSIPDMVWLKDTKGRYQSCNHAFERLIGKSESEIIGKVDADLFEDGKLKPTREEHREFLQAGVLCLSEEWVIYPDTGKRALLEMRKVPVSDTNGNVTGVLTVARDITERRNFEETLAVREREFRTLVENSPDTIARYGSDLRRLYVNPTFASLGENGETTWVGGRPSEYPGGPRAILYEQQLREVFENGRELEFELEWMLGNGKKLRHLVTLTPEFATDGTVETVLGVGRDVSELYASREEIHRMAFYDPLTSLPNRALFSSRLSEQLADVSAASDKVTGVMMLDLDRFKEVNDTMGHAVGDELLCEAAARLRACVRREDTVARLGGDEFAIMAPGIRDRSSLEDLCRKIIHRFDEPFFLDGKEVFVSCSIGIALHPTDGLRADDLIKYADSAMYLAKRTGRRDFRFYSKELTVDAAARLTLGSVLRQAIKGGEFELYYQPKVALTDHGVIGSEGLLRWHRPGIGMIAPQEFIPVAEETGLIVELGAWVLREACFTAVEQNPEGAPLHKVAVNLSARQFQFQDLTAMVHHILADTGCRPEWLELEITESLLLDGNDKVMDTLSGLRSMGVSVAIDDFGTGYSALAYLTKFPIDTLKIDKSFIQKVTTDSRQAELVKAILSIADCLGQQVVAEGVETAEQAAFLRANGCHIAQGYLFSKPVPKSELAILPKYFDSL